MLGHFFKIWGFKFCFDGVQGSSTLHLGILEVFPKTFSELELVVPFCLHHLTNVFIKPIMTKKSQINITHIFLTHGNILKLNLGIEILFHRFSIELMKVMFFLLEIKWGFEMDGVNRYPMVLGY
jgi:hypothetical protein